MILNCLVNKPYPKIKVEKKSKQVSDILSYLYASNEGELTAILQYSYETFLIKEEEIRSIIKQISIVEMHHLEILGKTIDLLGFNPYFGEVCKNKINYWNGDFVYYDTDLKTMLGINIEEEKNAIKNYQMALNVIDDIYVKESIKRILEDEYLHLEIFMKLRQNLLSLGEKNA